MIGEVEDEELETERKRLFPQTIDPENIVDCMTIGLNEIMPGAIQAYNIHPGAAELPYSHTDSGNDRSPGHDIQGIISAFYAAFKDDEAQVDQVFSPGSKDTQDLSINSFYRVWAGCYNKHACTLSACCYRWMSIVIETLDAFYQSQDKSRRSLMATLLAFQDQAREAFQTLGKDFIEFFGSFTKTLMLGTIHDSKSKLAIRCDGV